MSNLIELYLVLPPAIMQIALALVFIVVIASAFLKEPINSSLTALVFIVSVCIAFGIPWAVYAIYPEINGLMQAIIAIPSCLIAFKVLNLVDKIEQYKANDNEQEKHNR